MYTLRIYNRYTYDYTEFEYLTKEECYNYLERNYSDSLEDPDTPYAFEILNSYGDIISF